MLGKLRKRLIDEAADEAQVDGQLVVVKLRHSDIFSVS